MTGGFVDLTLRCPTCGKRADMCFSHGDVWKKRERDHTPSERMRMTDHELRASVHEFTGDDPPPYAPAVWWCANCALELPENFCPACGRSLSAADLSPLPVNDNEAGASSPEAAPTSSPTGG